MCISCIFISGNYFNSSANRKLMTPWFQCRWELHNYLELGFCFNLSKVKTCFFQNYNVKCVAQNRFDGIFALKKYIDRNPCSIDTSKNIKKVMRISNGFGKFPGNGRKGLKLIRMIKCRLKLTIQNKKNFGTVQHTVLPQLKFQKFDGFSHFTFHISSNRVMIFRSQTAGGKTIGSAPYEV